MQSDTLPLLAAIADRALPQPSDLRQAEVGLGQCREIGLDKVVDDPEGRRLLAAVFGNSPFLGRCILSEPAFFQDLLTKDVDSVFSTLLARLHPAEMLGSAGVRDEETLMQELRRAKRQAALAIALADISGAWPLEKVTLALSGFAQAALQASVSHLLRQGHDTGQITLPCPDRPETGSGLIVLGLGKLGAGELNYSSDIDLIVLYERDKVAYTGRKTVQEFFVRLARTLVKLLQDATADGYVFRVDLRLRPDPGSTPLALSTLAAENYYEGMGQNWERAAMIKARVVAGDADAGEQFLKKLRPFIWRKHLDFAAIEDIHSIKRQIHAVKGHREVKVAGHNIKLGRGGIREIEFFAQTQQLIWGGRNPELRPRATLDAIEALVAHGKTRRQVANDLTAAYKYLRHVEHRLQMIDDQQTQTLPLEGPMLDRVALFADHGSTPEFEFMLRYHLGKVEDHYAGLFEEAPSLGGPGSLVFTGTEDDPETVKTLQQMGFPDGSLVSGLVRTWHHGRYRATRSARARELLTELMPRLLEALSKTADPDTAFRRFDDFLQALPAGVQVFALLYSNPDLLDLIAEVMGGAPLLAEHLSRSPALLDGVLSLGFFDRIPDREGMAADLARQLSYATDFQDALDICRRWTKDRQFQIGVRLLRGIQDGDQAGGALSDVADCAIGALYPLVAAEFSRLHGTLPGRGMAIVALGKLGSQEMTVTSDLDLIFIYDIPHGIENWDTALSNGPKPLAPIQYYARLAHRLIGAITAMTGEGRLFDVDMRLRPSGNSGPIASGLAPFEKYQTGEAWTWEHMALTRARVIHGEPGLVAEVEAMLKRILTMPRDANKIATDILDMRQRILQQHRGDNLWDLKHFRGGQVDIDFITQFLQLRYAHERPEVLRRNPTDALAQAKDLRLMDVAAADGLIETARLWRKLQQMLRLMVAGKIAEATLPEPTKRRLAGIAGCNDFTGLKQLMSGRAAQALGQFERIIHASPKN